MARLSKIRKIVILFSLFISVGFVYQNCAPGFKTSNLQLDSSALASGSKKYPSFRAMMQGMEYESIPKGIPGEIGSNYVYKIAQDINGRMYFATKHGISISDDFGITFKIKGLEAGLASDNILDIFIDPKTNIVYLSTADGLAVSSDHCETFKTLKEDKGILSPYLVKTFVDSKGFIYSIGGKAIYVSENNGQSFNEYPIGEYRNFSYVDVNGNFYLGKSDGLKISADRGANYKTITTANGLRDNNVSGLLVDPAGILYVLNGSAGRSFLSVSKNNGGSFTSIEITNLTKSYLSPFMFIDSLGRLIVATGEGIIYASTNQGVSLFQIAVVDGYTTELLFRTVRPFVSKNGAIYLGSSNNGLFHNSNGGKFINKKPTGPYFKLATRGNAIYESKNGNIFVADNSGLFLSKNNGVSFDLVLNIPASSIAEDSKGNIFVGTMYGLKVSNDSGANFVGLNYGGKVGILFIDSKDKIYLSATNSQSIFVSNDLGKSFTELKTYTATTFYASNMVSSIFVDKNDNIYVGLGQPNIYNTWTITPPDPSVFEGNTAPISFLYSRDNGKTFKGRSLDNGLGAGVVNSVFVDDRNNIYVGTETGLSISTDGGDTFINKLIDLKDSNNVRRVIVDHGGIIYAGTMTGSLTSDSSGLSVSVDGGLTFISKSVGNTIDLFINSKGIQYIMSSDGQPWIDTAARISRSTAALTWPAKFPASNPPFVKSGANLIIESFEMTPSAPVFGDKLKFKITAKNAGTTAVPIGSIIKFQTHSVLSGYNRYTEFKLTSPLEPNQTIASDINGVKLELPTVVGTDFIIPSVSPEFSIPESNYQDNSTYRFLRIENPNGKPVTTNTTVTGPLNSRTVTVHLDIDPINIGKPGEVYIVALFNKKIYFKGADAATGWQNMVIPLEHSNFSSLPRFYSGQLKASFDIELAKDADLNGVIGAEIYVGYGTSNYSYDTWTDLLKANRYQLVYKVQP